ncbi:MAG TPA: substrate-binding domain-containing protein [Dongiaceae bacterium]|nr:substrate-binding domain-containing protein [Dongiaceae bacterium]
MTSARRAVLSLLLAAAVALGGARAEERFITVASTTSTQDSGLFEYLLPIFTKKTGIAVHVVAVGTGQAIKIGQQGDADVLFVHDRAGEEKFVAEGYGVKREPLMYNDFILVGPEADPAHVRGDKDAVDSLRKIAAGQAAFVSRGDDSGTNRMELRLWKQAGIDVKAASGGWYKSLGQGMGPTLNTAAAMDAYTLADRATWNKFANKQHLALLVEGDRRLFNQYGVILVNPARFPHVKAADGQAFIDWLISPEGQAAIAGYRINGEPAFFPDHDQPGA